VIQHRTPRISLCVIVAALGMVTACHRDPEQVKNTHLKAGDGYVAQQKYREAIIEYRSAIQAVPRSGPAHLKLGDAYFENGDARNGVREYLRAGDLSQDDVEIQLKAGRALLLAGRFDEARDRARKLLAKNGRNVEAQILLGNALAALKDLDGAIAEVESAIDADPQRSLSYTNLGMLRLAKGDRDQAEAALKQAVEIDPHSIDAALALANLQWSAGNTSDAEQELQRAVTIDPKSIVAHRALAAFYLGTKRAPEAEPHLRAVADASHAIGPKLILADYLRAVDKVDAARTVLEAVSADPDGFVPAQSRLASIQYAAGNTVDAHKTIDAVLARNGKDAAAQLLKARFLATERHLPEALEHAVKAVASAPQMPTAHAMAGSLNAMMENVDEAIKSFQEVLRLRPGDAKAETALAKLYASRADWPSSLQHAESAVKAAPKSGEAHLQLARALTETGDLHRAEPELKWLSAQGDDNPAVQYALGRFYLRSNDKAKARVALVKAANNKQDQAAIGQLVALDLAEGKPADARARLADRLQANPKSSPLLMMAAGLDEASGDHAGAESKLRAAIAADPSRLDGYQALARLFIAQHRLGEARQEYEGIAQRDPKSVGAHTMAAVLLEQEGKQQEAQKHYEQALVANPRAPVAANNLAWLMTQTGGNLDVALQLAQTAKAELPKQPEIDDTLGWIYYRKGLATLAINSLKQAVEASPHDPVVRYHLGLAYAKNDDKDRARQLLEQALAIKPDFDGAADARQLLRTLAS
jgi:putative PEP-CTERM system TPR-repeat lipoprotein